MREKPILFSTPMVQAILDDRKSMTRRVIKPQPSENVNRVIMERGLEGTVRAKFMANTYCLSRYDSPQYQPGDILWVRETWQNLAEDSDDGEMYNNWLYKADKENTPFGHDDEGNPFYLKWRPSIHMPKVAARIWLEVVSVRVERLQEITYDDCLREGMWNYGTDVDTLAAFQELWQNLNAKHGYDWDINPWVWVVEFKKVEGGQDNA